MTLKLYTYMPIIPHAPGVIIIMTAQSLAASPSPAPAPASAS